MSNEDAWSVEYPFDMNGEEPGPNVYIDLKKSEKWAQEALKRLEEALNRAEIESRNGERHVLTEEEIEEYLKLLESLNSLEEDMKPLPAKPENPKPSPSYKISSCMFNAPAQVDSAKEGTPELI